MASGKRREEAPAQGIAGLSERQERLLIYAVIVVLILVLFALEPGFFLGLVLGIIGYRYYLDNYSKNEEAGKR